MNRLEQCRQYTDMDIIAGILAGDAALYEIIIRRYNSCLFKVGRSYGFNHPDTEDLMQETYLSAYTHLGKFENRASFKTWLIKIMLHECYRKRQRSSFQKETSYNTYEQENATPMFAQRNTDTDKTIINKELGHILENALLQIPEEYCMVFTLRELNGLNTHETAGALNISENNVKVRLNRARAMLRTEITKMYSPDEIFEFNLIYCDAIVAIILSRIEMS